MNLMKAQVLHSKKEFEGLKRALYLNNPIKKNEVLKQRVKNLKKSLTKEMLSIFNQKKNELLVLNEKLDSLSPLKVLTRGYTIVLNKEGQVITSSRKVKTSEEVDILFSDGRATAVVKEVKEDGERI
jgi:exodeoxyribonuclease VII large subunit